MGLSPEVKLVIKHTFLEYVGDSKASSVQSQKRQRSLTESAICDNLDYGEIRELLHGSESSSGSSLQGDCSGDEFDSWHTSQASTLDTATFSTPEVTPMLCPMARHVPGWLQEDWAESVLPEPMCTMQQVDEYCQQSDQYAISDWWASNPVAVDMNLPFDCCHFSGAGSRSQFQLGFPIREQVYMSMSERESCHNLLMVAEAGSRANETRTSVMLRDLPELYSRSSLLKLLEAEGFFGQFDFIYVPVDFKNKRNLGYALINLVGPAEALRFMAHFSGFSRWGVPSEKTCSVGWCSPQQGLEAYVERYRNSPVMHQSVPDEWRPLLLCHGVPVPFPAPTQKIKQPKVKGRQN
jgi:hypothetical protein